jgi:hypothetical protein
MNDMVGGGSDGFGFLAEDLYSFILTRDYCSWREELPYGT